MDKQSFRDMCAAMAMQGILASPQGANIRGSDIVASKAFDYADAMQAERERRANAPNMRY